MFLEQHNHLNRKPQIAWIEHMRRKAALRISQIFRFPTELSLFCKKESQSLNRFSLRYLTSDRRENLIDRITGSRDIRYYLDGQENILLFHEDHLLCGIGFNKAGKGLLIYQIQGAKYRNNKNTVLHDIDWESFLVDFVERWGSLKGVKYIDILPSNFQAWRNNVVLPRTVEDQHAILDRIYDDTARARGYGEKVPLSLKQHPQREALDSLKGGGIDPHIDTDNMYVYRKWL